MRVTGRSLLAIAPGLLAVAAGLSLPAGTGHAAELAATPALLYDLTGFSATPAAADPASAQPADDEQADRPAINPDALRCMAKVIYHEARNQPRKGQLAVAQTLLNRKKVGGRFGDTICEVANKPGQYFNTHAYHPDEDSDGWANAVDVAREALTGGADPVVPGALFYRASYRPATSFFRSRQAVATIGAHIFYR